MLFSHVFTPLMTKSIGQRIRLTTLPWCLGPGSQAPACCCFKRIYPQSFCWRHHFEVTQCSLTPSDFPIVWAWNMLAHSTASPFCCSAFIRFLLLQSETIKIIIFSFFHFHFHYHFSFYLHFFIFVHHLLPSNFIFLICNFIFSICNFIFFRFPLFLMVLDCFSLIFMAFLDFRCHGQGQWKKNDKKMKISSSFWRFPGSEWESATLSPNFHFFSFATSFFFSFSFVFDGIPLFFIVFHGFPGFQVPRARKMKKEWSLEKQKTKKKNEQKMKNEWKQKKDWKTKWKKWSYKWKPKWKINEKKYNFKHVQSVAWCESYKI